MHPLEKEIATFIRNERLLDPAGETVVVAVSGGPDSICLLHLLARLAGQLHITPVATYVNHGLRPNEADQEQKLVRDTAEKLHCNCELGTVDVRGYAASHHLSIEHAARILRYNFFEAIAERYVADKIALAHTADDQAEELLLRLIRGTGRTGLAGMEAKRQERYIRPLLSIPKSRLLDYLQQFQIDFAHDSSNRQRIYLRNKIRLDLVPYLTREFNPNIRQNLIQTANILHDEDALLSEMTEQACRDIFIETETLSGSNAARSVATTLHLTIDLCRFLKCPRAIQRRVLEKACWRMGNKPYARNIEQLLQLTLQEGSGGRLHLANGLRVHKLSNRLCFTYPAGRVARRGDLTTDTDDRSLFEYEITGPGTWRLDHFGLTVAVTFLDRNAAEPMNPDDNSEYLDLDRITFPLTIRTPQPTDRFIPLGSPGRKKISRFLKDQKIERQLRGNIPVLVSDNMVLALVGLRIDHRFRVTPATRRVMHITWHRE
jgi:tRNA(Ile)-lysidine synthase